MPPIPVDDTLYRRVWLDGELEPHLDAVYNGASDGRTLLSNVAGPPLTDTKVRLSRAIGRTTRAMGRGGGTAAPGRHLLRLAPHAISTLGARLADGVVLVSGTNGKTTTARMLATVLAADGRAVVHNRAGANTNWGIATALAERDGDIAVLEVDEAWLPLLAGQLRPRLIVLGNLSRDRLDGYGELDRLLALWRGLAAAGGATDAIVLNADDPLLAGPGGVADASRATVLTFGIADGAAGDPQPEHPHDGHSCAACGDRLVYTRAFIAHLGHYDCARCERGRPTPDTAAVKVAERGLDGIDVTLSLGGRTVDLALAQPGLHNVHNALAAATAAAALGVEPRLIAEGLRDVMPPFGRAERIALDGRVVHLCLAKNPAGLNATMRLLVRDVETHPLHLWVALNDGHADGRDVSWIWDCDFEQLRGHVAAVTCSGRRAYELAVRIKCAEWGGRIDVDPDLDRSFASALRGAERTLVALPTYTALLGLRPVLNRRGVVVSDWAMAAQSSC